MKFGALFFFEIFKIAVQDFHIINAGDPAKELSDWLAEPALALFPDGDYLNIWKKFYSAKYPLLYQLVLKYSCIQVSAAAVERLWSAAGRVLTTQRLSLSDKTFQKIMFLKMNSDTLNLNIPKPSKKRKRDE